MRKQGKESHSNQWDPLREFKGTLLWGIIQGNESTLTMGPLGEVPKKPLLWGISANVVEVEKSETNNKR